MITLNTGQPGAGKTLYTLYFVEALARKENRQVYYNGIAELKIPGWIELDNPEDWYKLPAGSIIVLDEAQRLFRPRGNGSAVPVYVEKLETHRHQGLDLFIITQHPMLLDTNVRRLVGRHFHVQRTFGMQRATVHEFPDLRTEPDKNRKGSVRHDFSYPKHVYEWYKSAEQHTVKRNIPARVWFFLMLPLIFAGLIVYGVYWWRTELQPATPEDLATPTTEVKSPGLVPASSAGKSAPQTTGEYIASYTPRIPGLPHTAPVYDKTQQVKTAPTPAACIASAKKCTCYTDQATPILMGEDLCRDIADNGYFDPTKESHQAAAALQDKAPPPVTMPAGAI